MIASLQGSAYMDVLEIERPVNAPDAVAGKSVPSNQFISTPAARRSANGAEPTMIGPRLDDSNASLAVIAQSLFRRREAELRGLAAIEYAHLWLAERCYRLARGTSLQSSRTG
jgi:hypothetical protein